MKFQCYNVNVAKDMNRRGTQVNLVVIREQKNAEKGFFFTHRRGPHGPHLGYQFNEILEKRVYFSAVSYCHLLYEFQRHEILL